MQRLNSKIRNREGEHENSNFPSSIWKVCCKEAQLLPSDSQTSCLHVSVCTWNNTCRYIYEKPTINFIKTTGSSTILENFHAHQEITLFIIDIIYHNVNVRIEYPAYVVLSKKEKFHFLSFLWLSQKKRQPFTWISSMLWTINMSCRSSIAPSIQLLKGAARLANSRWSWSIVSSNFSVLCIGWKR